MELLLAIMWSIVLMIDLASALVGNAPSWMLVFCPLSILVLKYWIDYFNKF